MKLFIKLACAFAILLTVQAGFADTSGSPAALNVKRIRFRLRPNGNSVGIGNVTMGFLGVHIFETPGGGPTDGAVLNGTLELALRDGNGLVVPVLVRLQGLTVGLGAGAARANQIKLHVDGFRGQSLRDLMTNFRGAHATAVYGGGVNYYYLRGGDGLTLSGWNPNQGLLFDVMLNEGIFIAPAPGIDPNVLDAILI